MFYRKCIPCFWHIRLQKCRDLENLVRGPSRSLEISPCDTAPTTFYWRYIVTMALSRVISEIFNVENVVTLKSGSKATQGHWRSLIRLIVYGFLLVFFSNFVPKTHRFWDIRLVSIQWPWNPSLGSLKVIENYTVQSGTHDFLLTFYSNHRPISHRFRDKRRYPLKIANFPTRCILCPRWKVTFGIGYRWRCQKKL